MGKLKRLWDLYRFPGFSPEHTCSGIFGDPRSRVIVLIRRGKKRFAVPVVTSIGRFTIERPGGFATCPVETCGFTWTWRSGGFSVAGVGK